MLGLSPLAGGGILSAVGLFISTTPYETMLTQETGLVDGGVTDANTLIIRSEVAAHAVLVGNSAWATAIETEQEQAIYRAMRWFASLEHRMKGCRSWPTTQELPYPRTNVFAYGREIDYNAIPKELKQGLYEAALLEQATPDAMSPSQETNIKRIKKKLDGVGEKETEYFGPGSVGAVSKPKVLGLINGFLTSGNSGWEAW